MFAEIDASGWVLIIGAVFLGITKIISMILEYHQAKDQARRDEAAAEKIEEVRKATLAAAEVRQAALVAVESHSTKLDAIADQINEVRKAANGLKDELVAKTEAEALARGRLEGAKP